MKKSNLTDIIKSLIHGMSKLGLALIIGGSLALSVNALIKDSVSNLFTGDSESEGKLQASNSLISSDEGEVETESDDDSIGEWVNDVVASATRLVKDTLGNGTLLVNGLNSNQDVVTGASTVLETSTTGNQVVGVQDTTTGATGKTVTIVTYAPDGTAITTIMSVGDDDDDDEDDDYYTEDDDDDEDDDYYKEDDDEEDDSDREHDDEDEEDEDEDDDDENHD